MTDTEIILDYLNRYYRIENFRFYDIENCKKDYGSKIVIKLIRVFSFSEDLTTTTLIQWGLAQGLTRELIENGWTKRDIPVEYEPKRKNRFIVTFPDHFHIQQWFVKSSARPSMVIKEKKILGFTYSKKIEWGPITMSFYDPIGPSTSFALMDIIKKNIHNKFDYKLELLDPTGVVIERWMIKNCLITSINFGTVSIEDDSITECNMIIKIGDAIEDISIYQS